MLWVLWVVGAVVSQLEVRRMTMMIPVRMLTTRMTMMLLLLLLLLLL